MKEIILTQDLLDRASQFLRQSAQGYNWGKGEFKNGVFEQLVDHFELPWVHEEIGDIPDWSDERVIKLWAELSTFEDYKNE